jgi:WD40 repeat protein
MGGLGQLQLPVPGTAQRVCLALDHSRWLATGKGTQSGRDRYWVGVWSLGKPAAERTYFGHSYLITSVAMDPTASLAASADAFGEIHVWDASTGRKLHLFKGLGKPVYKVALDPSGQRFHYGGVPLPAGRWDRNQFGELLQSFDFSKRAITSVSSDVLPKPAISSGQRQLKLQWQESNYFIHCLKQGQIESRYKVRTGVSPMCYGFLRSSRLGLSAPVMVGDDHGGVVCYNPENSDERREFMGHEAFVTALAESADGRFLATSSTDRTLRIWSLENYQPLGKVDFKYLADNVTEVKPGSPSQRAGIKVGDRFVSMDSHSLTKLEQMRLRGEYRYQPGQQVKVGMERKGQPYEVVLPLKEGHDQVDPLLSLFITESDDWVAWTPQGYYDASPGGDRLIGWHVNQGPDKSAKFYLGEQFRKQLYRPDIIDRIFQTGEVVQAVQDANSQLARPPESFDLRQAKAIEKLEPPQVRILNPPDQRETQEPSIDIKAAVQSQNSMPVEEVTFLLNGRPVASKLKVTPASTTHELTREVALSPGHNEIAVVASNQATNSEPQKFSITYRPRRAETTKPSLYLLSIGISQYQQSALNLQFADRDAQEFASAMSRQAGGVYATVESKVLVNQEASRTAILEGMDWLIKSSTQRDVVMLFVSAHGFRDNRQDFYLATHEVNQESLRSTGLAFHEVNRLIEDLPCKVLLFVDSCHAGGVTGAKGRVDDPLRDLVTAEVGAIVFASSTPRELSLEDSMWDRHGAFTKALLDTMTQPESDIDKPQDGYISVTELEFNVARRVKEITGGRQHPVTQKPPTIRDFPLLKLLTAEGN